MCESPGNLSKTKFLIQEAWGLALNYAFSNKLLADPKANSPWTTVGKQGSHGSKDSNQTPWQLNSLTDANAFCKPSIPEGEDRGKFISPALGSDHPGESPGEL